MSLAMGAVMLASFTACNDDDDDKVLPKTDDIVDVLSDDANFTTLVAAVDKAGLVDALKGVGPFTVFGPDNMAFEEFLSDNKMTADALLASPDLANILKYHVAAGNIKAADVTAGPVKSLTGDNFYISIAPDKGVWINGNTKVKAVDKLASNGVIHTLDYVITAPTQNIAEIAVASTQASSPEFTQLVAALTRADLVEAISGGKTDNLTVFAPTDAAFADLYTALGVAGVNEIPLDVLTDVLLYHVVPARAFSQDLREGAELPTLLEGKKLKVNLGDLKINDAGLVANMLNIHGTNGVIHVINKVMLPK